LHGVIAALAMRITAEIVTREVHAYNLHQYWWCGVSRDHVISVAYGFENNIDPLIIKHPANCQLLRHSDNSSKHIKCDMVIENLLEKINKWNKTV